MPLSLKSKISNFFFGSAYNSKNANNKKKVYMPHALLNRIEINVGNKATVQPTFIAISSFQIFYQASNQKTEPIPKILK